MILILLGHEMVTSSMGKEEEEEDEMHKSNNELEKHPSRTDRQPPSANTTGQLACKFGEDVAQMAEVILQVQHKAAWSSKGTRSTNMWQSSQPPWPRCATVFEKEGHA